MHAGRVPLSTTPAPAERIQRVEAQLIAEASNAARRRRADTELYAAPIRSGRSASGARSPLMGERSTIRRAHQGLHLGRPIRPRGDGGRTAFAQLRRGRAALLTDGADQLGLAHLRAAVDLQSCRLPT